MLLYVLFGLYLKKMCCLVLSDRNSFLNLMKEESAICSDFFSHTGELRIIMGVFGWVANP
jgi:hypothetical protein